MITKLVDKAVDHIRSADQFTGVVMDRTLSQSYLFHAKFAGKSSWMLFKISMKGFIHALLPCFFDFDLLKEEYNVLYYQKRVLPNLPQWDEYRDQLTEMRSFRNGT